jgi:3-oxoacyl-[acyl-carrier-protein] synthase-1
VIEDFIWQQSAEDARKIEDPFAVVLNDFISAAPELGQPLSCNISNACASSHVALEYAQDLFAMGRIDYAIVIAADLIGPFVYQGFYSLKVLSQTQNKPFSADRDGLQLGEAITMMVLTKTPTALQIAGVASDTEGTSITRPSMNGASLAKTFEILQKSVSKFQPDLIVAHGTGTKFNDMAEDRALHSFFSKNDSLRAPAVTNTKWSLGHTLGASGMIDLIAACEILKSGKVFPIAATTKSDTTLTMNYLNSTTARDFQNPVQQVLINSLGFGGVHASLLVQKAEASL